MADEEYDPFTPDKIDIDLGDGHALKYTSWKPDRDLNPQYADLADVERIGAIVSHVKPDGSKCWSGIFFECEATRRAFPGHAVWTVESWEPLTLSPSLLCRLCNDHGFIRDGRWVRA